MATAKTGSFWLTERVNITTVDTFTQGTIDLGAYVDVGDQQALSIEQVDFIVQVLNTATGSVNNNLGAAWAGNATVSFQLSDQPAPADSLLFASDSSLIASGALYYDDGNNIASMGSDMYPDSFGKLADSRMVVNDILSFNCLSAITALAANREVVVTARIKAKIVKLGVKDWMSIAISSTSQDA